MKRYLVLFTSLIVALFVFVSLLSPSISYAVPCCIAGGGSCIEYSHLTACDTGKVSCTIDGELPDECNVNISPPPQVRITDFGRLFSGVVAFLLLAAFILSFFFLILGGISWLTSGGDKAAVEAARNKIIAALVGLVIVAATWALFQLVGGAIGFNILGGFDIPTLF